MEFIWIGLFFAVLIISFVLAMRSMKNFQEIPLQHLEYSLFLIQNPDFLTQEALKKFHDLARALECVISLEKLTKGHQTVIALYAPRQFVASFPELGLLELEDYISVPKPEKGSEVETTSTKINKDISLPWVIAPKNRAKELDFQEGFFNKISLSEMQHFFWQIVMQPLKQNDNFQVTIRAMVVEKEPAKRVDLAKHIDNLINESTGLIKESRDHSSGIIFESFAKRTIVPYEVSKFELNNNEILKLLN